jgi:hypothetical protein
VSSLPHNLSPLFHRYLTFFNTSLAHLYWNTLSNTANRYLVLSKKLEKSVDQGRDIGNSDPSDNDDNDSRDIEHEMSLVPSGGGSIDNDESVMLVQSFSENNQKRLKGSVNLAATSFMAAEKSVARGEIPKTFNQVLKSEEKDKWLGACQEEMDAHTENGRSLSCNSNILSTKILSIL